MKCPFCDVNVTSGTQFCLNCGAEIGKLDVPKAPLTSPPPPSFYNQPENSFNPHDEPISTYDVISENEKSNGEVFPSGNKVFDLEWVKGWNWGAFFLNWIWIMGNGYVLYGFICLLIMIFFPFAGFVIPFVLGAKANEYLWQNKYYPSVDEFKKIQKKWAIAGIVLFVLQVLIGFTIFGLYLIGVSN